VSGAEYQTGLNDDDEAIDRWGSATLGQDPLLASFTLEPYAPVRPHVPFYRFFHYPDVLDLRSSGFEVDDFIEIFDSLDNARYSQALQINYLLHYQEPNMLWNPRRAREFEFQIRASLHKFGLSDVPLLLRRMLGRAFPDDSISTLSIDLLNVYFWAALSKVARKYSWKQPELDRFASYLEYPLEVAGLLPERRQDAA
jgi:hypothetical protein